MRQLITVMSLDESDLTTNDRNRFHMYNLYMYIQWTD